MHQSQTVRTMKFTMDYRRTSPRQLQAFGTGTDNRFAALSDEVIDNRYLFRTLPGWYLTDFGLGRLVKSNHSLRSDADVSERLSRRLLALITRERQGWQELLYLTDGSVSSDSDDESSAISRVDSTEVARICPGCQQSLAPYQPCDYCQDLADKAAIEAQIDANRQQMAWIEQTCAELARVEAERFAAIAADYGAAYQQQIMWTPTVVIPVFDGYGQMIGWYFPERFDQQPVEREPCDLPACEGTGECWCY